MSVQNDILKTAQLFDNLRTINNTFVLNQLAETVNSVYLHFIHKTNDMNSVIKDLERQLLECKDLCGRKEKYADEISERLRRKENSPRSINHHMGYDN